MEMNGGFLVTKIKQLGDRIFEKILSEKNIDELNLLCCLIAKKAVPDFIKTATVKAQILMCFII